MGSSPELPVQPLPDATQPAPHDRCKTSMNTITIHRPRRLPPHAVAGPCSTPVCGLLIVFNRLVIVFNPDQTMFIPASILLRQQVILFMHLR